ncbi:MAG: hypothetical protein M5U12_09535 [Verrucomicrobia bacterium]|nr:hypothetical protein [Verrucomicrobiota bacterium]
MTLRANIERWLPVAAAALFGATHALWLPSTYPPRGEDLISAVLDISGIAVGFLATGQALLCSMTDNFVVSTLRKHGRFNDMLRMFSVAIYWLLGLVIYSLLSFFADFQTHHVLFSLWIALLAGASVATLQILRLFHKILRVPSPS